MGACTRAGTPGALRKRCQARLNARLHPCRHSWTRARNALGLAAMSDKLLREFWSGGDGLLAGITNDRLLI
eukprot:2582268-Pyramimonas_sp.AAC.1